MDGDGLLLAAHRDSLLALEGDALRPLWAFPSDGDDTDVEALYGTPAVSAGAVYLPGYDGRLYALDTETGVPRWAEAFDTGDRLIGGVEIGGGAIYFGSDNGRVYALDVESGQQLWAPFETGDGVWSKPALAGDTLYVTSLDGSLYALEAATGIERWSFSTDAGIASSPVVADATGFVIFGGLDGRLRAIDPELKDEVWSIKADNWFWTTPLIADGVVYAGSADGKVYAARVGNGEPHWAAPYKTNGPVRAAPVMVGGNLFVVERDGVVHKIDAASGTAAMSPVTLGSNVLADPIVVERGATDDGPGGVGLIVVTTDGELVRLDAETLQITQRLPLS